MTTTQDYTLYAIYRNGEPLKRGAGISRNAFDKKGSAKAIVTGFVEQDYRRTARDMYGSDYYYKVSKEDEEALKKNIRAQYEIKEFAPK